MRVSGELGIHYSEALTGTECTHEKITGMVAQTSRKHGLCDVDLVCVGSMQVGIWGNRATRVPFFQVDFGLGWR